jgi:ABC-type thiamin/hydroxymethylpyrimidine transport system permease subunit
MRVVGWKLRARVFLERLWQPTCACITCMTAPSFANLVSAVHWKIALQTGVGTGILALLLTLTPLGRLFAHRYGNALMVGVLTALADAWSHPGRFGFEYGEALLTGLVSGVLALAGSFVLEDRARRVREMWARVRVRVAALRR